MSISNATVTVPLAALPEARAAAEPDAPAIADDAVQLDNAAFAERVARAAARLARLGVGPGDVVAIALPNRLELVIALFAAWRLGAAATPVNPALTPRRDAVPGRRRRGEGRDRRGPRARRPRRRASAALEAEPSAAPPRRSTSARRARAADLHERHDRQAQGRDARPRQPRRDVRHDARRRSASRPRTTACWSCRCSTSTGSSSARSHPLLAGGQRDDRRAVQPEDVLRHRRAGPADVLLGGAGDLRDADLAAGGRDGRHVLAAARGLRRGADAAPS